MKTTKTLQEAVSAMDAANKILNEAKKKYQEEGQEKLKEVFKAFFAEVPEIKTVIWTQYTPYFNDGETCTFNVHDPAFTNIEADSEDFNDIKYNDYIGEKEDLFYIEYFYDDCTEAAGISANSKKTMHKLSAIICGNDELMEFMFGDHVKIIVTKNGFSIQDYDHD